MNHWIIAPVVLPAVLAPFIVLAARYHIGIQRVFSVAGVIALIAVASGLAWQASDGTITLYQLGDWAAAFWDRTGWGSIVDNHDSAYGCSGPDGLALRHWVRLG